MNINQAQRDYELSDTELICIATYLITENKSWAWEKTIGINSKSNNKTVISSQWFANPKVQKFIFDNQERLKSLTNIKEYKKVKETKMFNSSATNTTNNYKLPNDSDAITPDNIKQKLEDLVNRVSDPKDKLAGLIKIADFVGLNNTGIDLTTPTIYLPARCSTCEFKR